MVKSKARTHFRQYIRNKPTKWGFKYWVLADITGFTCNFNLYCGRQRGRAISDNGLAFDVVMELLESFQYQGYSVFFDNLYTSPALVHALKDQGISATGTLRTNRRGLPESVKQLKTALSRSDVPRGTGYYIRDNDDVYVCWRDNSVVCVMTNCYPGHSERTVRRSGRNQDGEFEPVDVPLPLPIEKYNQYMGGVDMSDQLISYHRIIRQTKKYWKTLCFHLLEICVTNAAIFQKWFCFVNGRKPPTMGTFRDDIVLEIIQQSSASSSTAVHDDFTIRHGSVAISGKRKRCAVCHVKCTRECKDCAFTPSLCQSNKKKCHDLWHQTESSVLRIAWFSSKKHAKFRSVSRRRSRRPTGSKQKKRSRSRLR